MRKRIIKPVQPTVESPGDAWLDLDALAEVEVTSPEYILAGRSVVVLISK